MFNFGLYVAVVAIIGAVGVAVLLVDHVLKCKRDTDYQARQALCFMSLIDYAMEQSAKASKQMMDDLTKTNKDV